ncbi:MAG: purine-binding chemotaxis protein CheW [Gammaproteobacteria bacterium]|nr:purine-binding chemotaxis protein CheW [Gammaproteobacteria bacterium]
MHGGAAATGAGAAIDDCWNKIGVHGDSSCPQLAQHIHCRNCPVFAAAATELLDGELPADYLQEWTRHFAQSQQIGQLNTESAVIFRIGVEWLALPTALFNEVAEHRAIHVLPHRRSSMILGLANVRGELLICVALDQTLGLEVVAESKRERQRLLVTSHEGNRLAFPVDEVHGTHRFHPQELMSVPATVAKATATYTKAILPWQQKSVGLLDHQLLFYTLNRGLA